MKWSFHKIWTESLLMRTEKPLVERQKIWASEVGKGFLDRYLKMKAVTYTNPPNNRSLRKFEAGNLLEWVVELILRRAGVLKDAGVWIEHTYEGLLPVSGKLDFLAGGKTDWEKAKAEIQVLKLPEFFNRATSRIIEHFKTAYPDGLETIVLEVKSCSSHMFNRYEAYGLETSKNHILQLFHYLKASGLREGHLVYICKDDLRMLEFGVYNPSSYESWYREDIEKMTEYILSNTQPPLEAEVIYNTDACKFTANWEIEYSVYLEKLYGYKEPSDYRDRWDKTLSSWNRTFRRHAEGKKLTALNIETIDAIKKQFPNLDELIEKAKRKGVKEENDEKENNEKGI